MGREVGTQGEEMEAEEEEEEEKVVGGRWSGLLAGLRNVNLHFSHLENRDREREMERVEKTEKGWYKINGCTAVTHSCFALPGESTGKVR